MPHPLDFHGRDHRADLVRLRCHLPEGLLSSGHLKSAIGLSHTIGEANQEDELVSKSNLSGIVLDAMTGVSNHCALADLDVVVNEDAFPRDFDVVEVHHCIVFVEPRRQWRVKFDMPSS